MVEEEELGWVMMGAVVRGWWGFGGVLWQGAIATTAVMGRSRHSRVMDGVVVKSVRRDGDGCREGGGQRECFGDCGKGMRKKMMRGGSVVLVVEDVERENVGEKFKVSAA